MLKYILESSFLIPLGSTGLVGNLLLVDCVCWYVRQSKMGQIGVLTQYLMRIQCACDVIQVLAKILKLFLTEILANILFLPGFLLCFW